MTTLNARITSTMLGIEDHGIMTFYLHLETPNFSIGYGGYCLDGYDKETKTRHGHASAYQAIRQILDTLGVQNWERLPNTLCRIEYDPRGGLAGKIQRIGHIMEDRWFDLAAHMAQANDQK